MTCLAYTEHPDNMLVREHRGVIEELDRMIDKHRALSSAAGVSFDRRSVFRWIAWAQRRAGRRRAAATTYLRAALSERSPSDLVRAGAALIGERAMREPARGTQGQPPAPAWLTRSVWRVPSNALCSSRYRVLGGGELYLLRTAEAVSRRWPRPWRGRRRRRSCSRPSERACRSSSISGASSGVAPRHATSLALSAPERESAR